jgi:hypothetical protein
MSIVVPAAPTSIVGQVLNNAANVVANNVNRLTGVAAAVAAPGPSANQLQATLNVQHEAARQSVNNAAAVVAQAPSSVNATDAAVLSQVVKHADALYNAASAEIAALRATGSIVDAQRATELTIAAEQALNNVIATSDQIASGRGSYGRRSSNGDDEIFDEAYFDTPARRYRERKYKQSGESRSVTSTRRQRAVSPKKKAAPKKKKSYPSASKSPAPRRATTQKKKPVRSVTTGARTVSVRGTPVRRRRANN